MNRDLCRKCIRDFYERRHEGNTKEEMDPNNYNFYFADEIEEHGNNWMYWWSRGILYGCIRTVPVCQPIGVESAKTLVKDCPYMKEHLIDYKDGEEYFMRRWLSGTDCRHNARPEVKWRDSSGRFIVAVHHGHTAYVDRGVGSGYCATYYALYDLKEIDEDPVIPKLFIKQWEGRWSKKVLQEVEEIVRARKA